MKFYTLSILVGSILAGCTKDNDPEIKEVVRETAWKEVTTLTRTGRFIQNMASDGQTIFLQQPNSFTPITGTNRIPTFYSTYITDIQIRIPIAPKFYATAFDTIVTFRKTASPLSSDAYPGKSVLSVKKLDPAAVKITTVLTGSPFEAPGTFSSVVINRNNYVLLHYSTTNAPAFRTTSASFILAAVDPDTPEGYAPRLLSARRITLPNVSSGHSTYIFDAIVSINDYFLVAFEGKLFKIQQDGTVRSVLSMFANNSSVSALYKWKGRLYCISDRNTFMSDDEGETWRTFAPVPQDLQRHRPYPIGDSLICTIGNNLISWHWREANASLRVLNNEGLDRSLINGIQVLRDTVYVGTTNGLFFRPLNKFFESKPAE
ncbi:hypothetical protein MUN82_14190 [Hymenobacter aerilatus]|uniref:Uncharacterized protein n=1 Tax=Hymenobacter aerilatus TaxID=2932251 RepID=A0A8T9SV47_9BACT|nr:hypothetical protein [Hymenobacter aerilatus]UOR04090.1 hypothetical protein MUN82_14190 [Hymenobacter aerilatus]